LGEASGGHKGVDPGVARPAGQGDTAVAGVDPANDSARPATAEGGEAVEIIKSAGPDDDALDADVFEQRRSGYVVAYSAAHLNRHADRVRDGADGLGVRRAPPEGSVEVHDVEPLRSRVLPAAGESGGIIVKHRFGVGTALKEADAAALAGVVLFEVDSGEDVHGNGQLRIES
jgi:hypothetical protein